MSGSNSLTIQYREKGNAVSILSHFWLHSSIWPCRRPELAFRTGCLQTHLTLCQLNSMVKAQAHLLSCTKHIREYGIREGDWDYHQDFLPQELLWRHKNSEKEPDIKPDATNSHGLDFSPPLQISHKTKQKQRGSQEKVYRSKMHFCQREFEKLWNY